MIENFHFIRPANLLLIVPVIGVWWLLHRSHDDQRAWRKLIAPHLLGALLVGGGRRRMQPIHWLLIAWLLACLALAGPSWRREPSPFAEEIAQMFVILKVSPSMMAEDLQPSRLERAKQKLRDLLEMREGAATGLIVYSGTAHLVIPPTKDGRVINTLAEGLDPSTMPRDGDALADAVELAGRLLAQSGRPGSVVVMADTVPALNLSDLESAVPPAQFWAVTPYGSPVGEGIQSAAKNLRAKYTKISIDDSDVETVRRRSASAVSAVDSGLEGERWKDDGYVLVPFVMLISLSWVRKGWST
jgi:Ca-activated chloride channel family protein